MVSRLILPDSLLKELESPKDEQKERKADLQVRKINTWRSKLCPGTKLVCLDIEENWCNATVLKVQDGKIFISYDGWSARWDEWVEVTSERLEPPGQKLNEQFITAAEKGKTSEVNRFLSDPELKIDIDFQVDCFKNGRTALYSAAHQGHLETVKYLTGRGASINKPNIAGGYTPVNVACFDKKLDVLQFLISQKADCDTPNKTGATPLHTAAMKGHLSCIQTLLASDVIDVNITTKTGATPLFKAAKNGKLDCLEEFLKHKSVKINMTNKAGSTPLYIATKNKHQDCVDVLLKHPDIKTETEWQLLWAFKEVSLGDYSLIGDYANFTGPELQRKCADVGGDAYSPAEGTIWKLLNSKRSIYDEVFQEMEDISMVENDTCRTNAVDGKAMLDEYATVEKVGKVGVGQKRQRDVDTDDEMEDDAADVVETETPRTIKMWVKKTSDELNEQLIVAAADGQLTIVKELVNRNLVDVNYQRLDFERGSTALALASGNKRVQCVEALINAPNVDVNKADKYLKRRNSLLCTLSTTGAPRSFNFLDGSTPLIYAASNGHVECVEALLNASIIDVNRTDEDGSTPLNFAADYGHVDCVKALLTVPNVDVNKPWKDGGTPLFFAACNGRAKCVSALLKALAIDANQAKQNGCTPLNGACLEGHAECVKILLSVKGIDLGKALSVSGDTALISAIKKDRTEIVKHLLMNDPPPDINKTDLSLTSPLMHAVLKGNSDVVSALLSHNQCTNPHLQNQDESTALGMCIRSDKKDLQQLILKKMCYILHDGLTFCNVSKNIPLDLIDLIALFAHSNEVGDSRFLIPLAEKVKVYHHLWE